MNGVYVLKQMKNNYRLKYVIAIIMGFVDALCYILIVYNYVYKKICIKSGSYVLVNIFYFAACILLMFKLFKPHISNTIHKKCVDVLYIMIVPAIAIYMEELIWNILFHELTIRSLMINYLLILMFTIILISIFQKPFIVYTAVIVICWLYGMINHYVYEFKGSPPLYSDFLVLETAVSVMGKYEFWLCDSVVYGTGLFIYTIILLIFFSPRKIYIKDKKKRILLSTGGFAAGVILSVAIYNFDIQKNLKMYVDSWTPVQSFYVNGAPITLLISTQTMRMEKPIGYSKDYALNLLEQYINREDEKNNTKLPTVIVIMNESFADLHILGEFESEAFLSNWQNMDSYIMRGYTYVSMCGGGTCNSEFEFLTGNSIANLNAGMYPYRLLNLDGIFNLADVFGNLGYETIAMHPYMADNWNRVQVYNWFGFDKYITMEDMNDIQYISWGASDQYNYEQIIEAYENRMAPMFLFNVTMQNHGGYEERLKEGVDTISIEKQYSRYVDVINYLTLIRESDRAFAQLLEYFSKQEEPVVICMFGDHQPALDEDFLESLISVDGIEDIEKRYMTPYVIWSNFDMQIKMEEKDMSVNYLAANLLNTLGIHTEYSSWLLDLEKEIPVINQIGYQTVDGMWHSTKENNKLISEYRILQYYQLFDK